MGHQRPEISGDEEGDPIWKLSNTNETGGGAGRQRIIIEHRALIFCARDSRFRIEARIDCLNKV